MASPVFSDRARASASRRWNGRLSNRSAASWAAATYSDGGTALGQRRQVGLPRRAAVGVGGDREADLQAGPERLADLAAEVGGQERGPGGWPARRHLGGDAPPACSIRSQTRQYSAGGSPGRRPVEPILGGHELEPGRDGD